MVLFCLNVIFLNFFFLMQVSVDILNQLIGQIKKEITSLTPNEETEQITKHFDNTIAHLQNRIESADTEDSVYKALEGLTL